MEIVTKLGIATFVKNNETSVIVRVNGEEKTLLKAFCKFTNVDGTDIDFSTLVNEVKVYDKLPSFEGKGKFESGKKRMKLSDIMSGIQELEGNGDKKYCPVRKMYV